MNENGNALQEIDDPSVEAVLKETRPAGELTTDERLERRRRQERDAVFNRLFASLNGAGYSVDEFVEWVGGKVEKPSTADKMREIRKERDKDADPKSRKPDDTVGESKPNPTEQRNGRTQKTPSGKAVGVSAKSTKT